MDVYLYFPLPHKTFNFKRKLEDFHIPLLPGNGYMIVNSNQWISGDIKRVEQNEAMNAITVIFEHCVTCYTDETTEEEEE